MFDEIDQQESKWRRILSRPIHPDDAPPLDEGFTTHQVYNAVRKNQLSNVNRKDAWGRTKRGPGLFVVRDESMRLDQLIVSTKDLATALTAWR